MQGHVSKSYKASLFLEKKFLRNLFNGSNKLTPAHPSRQRQIFLLEPVKAFLRHKKHCRTRKKGILCVTFIRKRHFTNKFQTFGKWLIPGEMSRRNSVHNFKVFLPDLLIRNVGEVSSSPNVDKENVEQKRFNI